MWKKCLGVFLDKKMGGFLDTLDPPFATQADDIRRLLIGVRLNRFLSRLTEPIVNDEYRLVAVNYGFNR